ncbi:MAG: HlyD family type I secretion periplasmic adaptor subunit, partial [Pseudomonadota bacterium]
MSAQLSHDNEAPEISRFAAKPLMIAFSVITLVFFILGYWIFHTQLDSAVIANGTVTVESNRKLVQHLEGGIVSEILVENGDVVRAGQTVLRLQSKTAQSNLDAIEARYIAQLLKSARLQGEQNLQRQISVPASIDTQRWEKLIADESHMMTQRRRVFEESIAIQEENIGQLQEQIIGVVAQIDSLQLQIDSLADELVGVQKLADKGYLGKSRALEMKRRLASYYGDLGAAQANLEELYLLISFRELEREKYKREFYAEALTEELDLVANIAKSYEDYTLAKDTLQRIEVTAPQDGIVQNLSVVTKGGVVTPSSPLLEIVPMDDTLIIHALLSPLDRDVAEVGNLADIRFSELTYDPNTKIRGTVEKISPDTIFMPEYAQEFYRATIKMDNTTIPPALRQQILPGITADVIILTGKQSIYNYFASPLTNAFNTEKSVSILESNAWG